MGQDPSKTMFPAVTLLPEAQILIKIGKQPIISFHICSLSGVQKKNPLQIAKNINIQETSKM